MEEETAHEVENKRLTYLLVGRGSDLNPYFYFFVFFFLALGTMLRISVGGGSFVYYFLLFSFLVFVKVFKYFFIFSII